MRTTIDYGIDLGTTNSAIAVLTNTITEIIKNVDQFDLTPSAVWIDRKGTVHVGEDAKAKLGREGETVAIEFKRNMGTSSEVLFKKINRQLKPEELSAEVLKSLKNNIKNRFDEDLIAAAITVPAAFEIPQCEATQRAARLAGIELCPLLQEPVAASLAYGFQGKDDEKEIWLVYDLGGGTFDTALMQMRDGIIQVLAHKGDNHLGGGLIDEAIVEQILIPELISRYKLTDFRRNNLKWNAKLAKLKLYAEETKIRLSSSNSKDLTIDDIGEDENGEKIEFDYELSREAVARLSEPYIRRSVAMSRELLREKKLGRSDISKVLMVGGPTFAPYLRAQLSDEKEGLGIPLDFSQDPMTVVARGAAIFAGTQRLRKTVSKPVAPNTYSLQLEYEPIGVESDPFIAGKVISQTEETFKDFSIEFVNKTSQPTWRSGKTPVNDDGGFATALWAQKNIRNEYKITLFDSIGTTRSVSPDSITYTIGSSPDKQQVLNDISIALKNNEIEIVFEKGTPLPLRKKNVYKQFGGVKKGNFEDSIRVPIVEGRNIKADRNKPLGIVEILASEIKRDLPANSEIEITFLIDESRTVDLQIYIPILDQEFERKLNLSEYRSPSVEKLTVDFDNEESRLIELKEKLKISPDSEAERVIEEIELDQSREIIARNLQDDENNDDTSQLETFNRLLDMRVKLDLIEDKFKVPALEAEAVEQLADTDAVVSQFGEENDRMRFVTLKCELQAALKAQQKNMPFIRERIDALSSLKIQVMARRPEWWIGYFEYLENNEEEMTDQNLAARLITAGRREINNGQLEHLQSLCAQLGGLLPDDERNLQEAYGSTVMRAG